MVLRWEEEDTWVLQAYLMSKGYCKGPEIVIWSGMISHFCNVKDIN